MEISAPAVLPLMTLLDPLELSGSGLTGVSGSCSPCQKAGSIWCLHSLLMRPLIPQLSSLDFHIGWRLGSKGRKWRSFRPHVGSAVSQPYCTPGAQDDDQLTRGQKLEPHHAWAGGGREGGVFGA